jgi:predicted methyltransferase
MARLTEFAHAAVRTVLRAGDAAIDATAGNGHDTRLLSAGVSQTGRVFAFDIQQDALERTAETIRSAINVTLLPINHAAMHEAIPLEYHGRIGAIMFNLGYLPGGDKALTTRVESTVRAIAAGLELLRPEGVLTILAYTGHAGGMEEAEAVEAMLNELSAVEFEVQEIRCEMDSKSAPRLFVVHKTTFVG